MFKVNKYTRMTSLGGGGGNEGTKLNLFKNNNRHQNDVSDLDVSVFLLLIVSTFSTTFITVIYYL